MNDSATDNENKNLIQPILVMPLDALPSEITPSASSFSVSPSSTTVSEGAGSVTFTITRSSSVGSETVYFSTSTNQGSSNNGDYTGILNQAVTFSAGQTSRTVSVNITNDSVVESSETFGIILDTSGGTVLDTSTFTITDNDTAASSFSVSPSSTTVSEGAGSVTFTITRSSSVGSETVYFSTSTNQGSSNNGDYTGILNQAVTFSAGQTSRTVSVNITNDSVVESSETFGIILDTSGGTVLDTSTFTITDNDTAASSFSVSPSSTTVSEGAGSVTFTITRSSSVGSETVYFSTSTNQGSSNNGDYTGILNQAVTFSAGQTSRTVSVNITNDSVVESSETFGIILDTSGGTVLDTSTFTITDNDTAASSFSVSPSSTTVSEGAGSVTFTITRSSSVGSETVYFSTSTNQGSSNNGDYTGILNQAVTFSAGQTSRTVSVNITNDSVVESSETFGIILDTSGGTVLDTSTFTITDNDGGVVPSTFNVTPSTKSVAEGAGSVTFTVTRSSSVGSETVYFSTAANQGSSNNGDYTGILNQAVTFSAGQTSRTVSVNITNDSVVESSETFGIILDTSGGTVLDTSTFTITDNDGGVVPSTFNVTPSTKSVAEGAGSLTFTVTRSSSVGSETVFFSTAANQGSSNSGDYTGIKDQAVVFAAGQTSKVVTINITNDTIKENTETFGIILDTAGGTVVDTATFTITDNDGGVEPSTFNVTPSTKTVAEGAGSLTFTVTRSSSVGSETVFFSTAANQGSSNSGDYTGIKDQAVVFAAGQTSKIVTINITNDTIKENTETFGIILDTSGGTVLDTATFTITDNDGGIVPPPPPTDFSKPIALANPIKGAITVTQGFGGDTSHGPGAYFAGEPFASEARYSVDIGADIGTAVYGMGDGTVVSFNEDASHKSGLGKFITVKMDNGTYVTFAHLSVVSVTSGDVNSNTILGQSGKTGTTDAHLHVQFGTELTSRSGSTAQFADGSGDDVPPAFIASFVTPTETAGLITNPFDQSQIRSTDIFGNANATNAEQTDGKGGPGTAVRSPRGVDADEDELDGSSASNRIFGLSGNDYLYGEGGKDTLVGGSGNDRLRGDVNGGQAYADTFVFRAGHGDDWIVDFNNGLDKMQIDNVNGYSGISVRAISGGVMIEYGDESIKVDNLTVAQIDTSDFIFI